MRRFRFGLEKILGLRRHHEREWEMKLARVAGACVLMQGEIDNRHGRKSDNLKAYGRSSGRIDLNELYNRDLYRSRLESEILALEQALVEKTAEREKVQEKYLDASRLRKVLDKLKERKQTEFIRIQKQEEFKALDDISTGNTSRRKIT